jgi:hypothetical protein
MSLSQQLSKAGDVSIELVQITTTQGFYQNITGQVLGLQLFEDIFSPFMTGTIEIQDSLDLLNVFPFNGEEFLELKLVTPTLEKGNIDGKFYIYKMANRAMIGNRTLIYTLHFVSMEAIVDINKKLSKVFYGKCSEIVKKILLEPENGLEVSKELFIEETSNSTKYISNFWSPIKNINSICETSLNQNGSGSYLFFENRYGFNFVSLEKLYNNSIYQDFTYDNYVRDIQSSNDSRTVKNVTEDYKRVRSIIIPTAYDYIDRASNGMYGSRLFTYDILTKKYNNVKYDMLDNYDSFNHLNKYPLASNKSVYRYNSFILSMSKYTGNFSGFGDVTNAGTVQQRVSSLAQINANKVEITVPGRMDYTVGLRIKLKLNKVEPVNKEDTDYQDEMFSGTYIIAAINHYINRNIHECTLEIIKDSLLMDLNRSK